MVLTSSSPSKGFRLDENSSHTGSTRSPKQAREIFSKLLFVGIWVLNYICHGILDESFHVHSDELFHL